MQNLKVKCPNCGRMNFETTEQFNPDARPHGGMVKCLLPYQIDWLCSSTTMASEMTCPECLAPLVVGNVLNVVMPAREAGEMFENQQIAQNMANAADEVLDREVHGDKSNSEIVKEVAEAANQVLDVFINKSTPETGEADFSNLKQSPPRARIFYEVEKFCAEVEQMEAVELPKTVDIKGFVCDICGRECKSELGLNSHKRSHKGGKK